jgi:hypothetical protein
LDGAYLSPYPQYVETYNSGWLVRAAPAHETGGAEVSAACEKESLKEER